MMKSSFLFVCLCLIQYMGHSQPSDTLYLWPGKVPGENEKKHDPVQTDNTSGNTTRITDITNPALVVFEPSSSKNNGAGVIICPGGGYSILAIDKEGYEIAQWLNGLGFTAFVLQYRVPQKQEGALMDVQRAMRLVRGNASQWKLNPDKIGVMGFSAGGNLSAEISTRYHQESYQKIDQTDNQSSRPDFALLIYPAYLDKGENRSLSPELSITGDTPPMFLFATADDKYANSALVMATSLRDAEIPVELHLLPKGGHGYGMRKGNVAGETWPGLAANWLLDIISNK